MVFDDLGADTVKELIPALNQFNANFANLIAVLTNIVEATNGAMAQVDGFRKQFAILTNQVTILTNKIDRMKASLRVDVI